jgi:hypothetical protein
MKERANYDVDYQCTTKYQQESKSTKQWVVPKELVDLYLKAVDKTAFLHKYGNEVNV